MRGDIALIPKPLIGQSGEIGGRVDFAQLHRHDTPAAFGTGFANADRTVRHQVAVADRMRHRYKPVRRGDRPDLQRLEKK
jgi:hypothetical protein